MFATETHLDQKSESVVTENWAQWSGVFSSKFCRHCNTIHNILKFQLHSYNIILAIIGQHQAWIIRTIIESLLNKTIFVNNKKNKKTDFQKVKEKKIRKK